MLALFDSMNKDKAETSPKQEVRLLLICAVEWRQQFQEFPILHDCFHEITLVDDADVTASELSKKLTHYRLRCWIVFHALTAEHL